MPSEMGVEIITPAVTFYNTVNGNYFDMELTVGGLIPRGSENGDKVYIIVVFNGSLGHLYRNSIRIRVGSRNK